MGVGEGLKGKMVFVTHENDLKFTFVLIKFYWNTAVLIRLCIVRRVVVTDHMACNA